MGELKIEFKVERYYPKQNDERFRFVVEVDGSEIGSGDTLMEAIKDFDESFGGWTDYLGW